MTRAEFLSQVWKSYPVAPDDAVYFGRLQEIQFLDSKWKVTLLREGRLSSHLFSNLTLSDSNSESPALGRAVDVLAPGDLVALNSQGVVTLLTPQLRRMPPRSFHWETLSLWQDYLYWVREYFKGQGFVEIHTPGLVPCPGTEPSLDVFKTELVWGSRREKLYLPTSPELHLKKALALGAEKIFEIKKCYRNGEVTPHHQPEFTMIEWYRAYKKLEVIREDVMGLVQYLVQKMPRLRAPQGFDVFSIPQLFQRFCYFQMTPDTDIHALRELATKLKVDVSAATQIDDYFFLIFLEKIEFQLPAERLAFVEKYPPYQAALARLTEEGWGDRFEVYWQGLELANAFHELNDPEIQRKRFAEDLAKKRALQKEEIPLDEEFLQFLEAGMPPSSGIALGLERLFMALTQISQISETRLFPFQT